MQIDDEEGCAQMEQTAEQTHRVQTWYLLEEQQGFAESLLWGLQQRYFAEKGVDAWRQGEVPHYITSNPTMANSYAEIVLAFLRDQQRLAPGDAPLYICELGAGSGRFAFHFLKRLTQLCEQAGVEPSSFRYIATDFTQANLDFWRRHPRFQPFFASGILDIALFNINQSDQLSLQLSGKRIGVATLDRPLIVIANYVFDSVPQELFYIDDQRCYRCQLSMIVGEDPRTLSISDLIARTHYRYDYQELSEPPYQEPYLLEIFQDYQLTLAKSHLLFPAAGLRCLERLKALSKQGMLVLSADKGDHHLSALQNCPPPCVVHHGSFSLSVNYHSFKTYCERDGLALLPSYGPNNVSVNCLLMVGEAADYVETKRAYQRYVQDFSPDDFYCISQHAQQYVANMSIEQILAYLRLSYYDSYQFAHYLPRLVELAGTLNADECQFLTYAIDKVWELYFPLGEVLDLANYIACLLYEIGDYQRSLIFFERSIEIYGQHTGTLYNMALCYQQLQQHEQAELLLQTVLQYDPDNHEARALLAGYEKDRSPDQCSTTLTQP
jgi:tetratricopeptide (TPR) repeat protein